MALRGISILKSWDLAMIPATASKLALSYHLFLTRGCFKKLLGYVVSVTRGFKK
jgi:hypothetical protein